LPWYAALTLPLAVMFLSDLAIWYQLDRRPFSLLVYGCYAFTVLLGMLLRRTNSPWKIGAAAAVSDVTFFLVTNFAAWRGLIGRPYPDSLDGLLQAYAAGLPFFQWTVVSSIIFVPVLFGAHALLTRPVVEAPPVANAPGSPV
jgi:hypothetical protein